MVLCCTVLYCAVLCCAVLYCAVLYCALMWYCVISCVIVVLYHVASSRIILFYVLLHCCIVDSFSVYYVRNKLSPFVFWYSSHTPLILSWILSPQLLYIHYLAIAICSNFWSNRILTYWIDSLVTGRYFNTNTHHITCQYTYIIHANTHTNTHTEYTSYYIPIHIHNTYQYTYRPHT